MAYLNLLAAVDERQVRTLRSDPAVLLRPSRLLAVSHLIGYWIHVQPLGGLLGQALDGGEALHAAVWHPLRVPVWHSPDSVQRLTGQLTAAWGAAKVTPALADDDYSRSEIERLLDLFGHAAGRGEGVVSALEPPADSERAERVRLPFARTEVEPPVPTDAAIGATGPLGPLWWLWIPGGIAGVAALGLCYWRYRRTTARTGPRRR